MISLALTQIWKLKTAEELLDFLAESFPQLDVKKVGDVSMFLSFQPVCESCFTISLWIDVRPDMPSDSAQRRGREVCQRPPRIVPPPPAQQEAAEGAELGLAGWLTG
eukprot:scaffold657831_cov75-Prasinocladus_malaysianus.AAC.2